MPRGTPFHQFHFGSTCQLAYFYLYQSVVGFQASFALLVRMKVIFTNVVSLRDDKEKHLHFFE